MYLEWTMSNDSTIPASTGVDTNNKGCIEPRQHRRGEARTPLARLILLLSSRAAVGSYRDSVDTSDQCNQNSVDGIDKSNKDYFQQNTTLIGLISFIVTI